MSRQIRWRAMWDAFATVATVATCIYVVLTVGVQKVRTAQAVKVPVGAVLKSGNALSFGTADLTVLIGMSSTCHFCEESLPALQVLAKYVASRSRRSQTVALTLEPRDALAAYLAKNGLKGVQPISIDSSAPLAMIAARTPQIVAVDGGGKVLASWSGRIAVDQAQTLIGQLPAPSSPH